MAFLPDLTERSQSRLVTEVFYGLDRNLKIADGAWQDEKNLTAEHFPLFSQRKKRGNVQQFTNPLGMLAKDTLVYIDGEYVYFGGYPVDGIEVSTSEDMQPKQMVSMGAYAVIFPDKVYFNTKDLTDHGNLDAEFNTLSTDNVTFQLCKLDGTDLGAGAIVSDTEPAEPENGAFWMDTSNNVHVLKQYSAASGMWVEIATTYIRIGCNGIGELFSEGDGVTINGIAYTDDNAVLKEQLESLNTDNIIRAKGDDYIVITGLIDQTWTQTTGTITVKRECPDMDFVTESNNRIWGCKYGIAGGVTVNEIYACKLGDFKNWRCYAGISTDSYAVSVGTDGKFTGAITHLGYPVFFKENCLHKIYGNMPSNYQMQTTMCRGVQEGSEGSLCIVNETLFYKSRTDVCAYDGSLPTSVSAPLGTDRYSNAVAGAMGAILYISMRHESGRWDMYTLDTNKAVWHREDGTHAMCFANVRGDLLYIDADTNRLISATGQTGAPEGDVEWSAESGIMGYEFPDAKYISRYNIRCKLGANATMSMFIEYDSDGMWVHMGTYPGAASVRTITVPIIPRRCDHMRLKLTGRGDIKIYSIARILEGGSDAWA